MKIGLNLKQWSPAGNDCKCVTSGWHLKSNIDNYLKYQNWKMQLAKRNKHK